MEAVHLKNADIGAIYSEYATSVLSFARSIVKDKAAAEDIMQTVFIKYCQNDHKKNKIRNVKAWLLKCTKNTALNSLRHRFDNVEYDETMPFYEKCSFEDNTILSLDVKRAFMALSDLEAQLFVLHHIDGYKYRELGEVFEMPVGTVKTYGHVAKNKLMKYFAQTEKEVLE